MKIIVDNFFTILLIMNILLSFIIVFRERKETAQTWAWLLVLMFIPVVGFILFLNLGCLGFWKLQRGSYSNAAFDCYGMYCHCFFAEKLCSIIDI